MFSFSPFKIFKTLFLFAFCSVVAVNAQSTNGDYPTPVTGNEVKGVIVPRDIGDSRATRYFYTFTGTPGDLFFTIESDNINGDVDVFTVNGLRPLSKITLFDLGGKTITTVSIYLRKTELLLLRIEAKTANEKKGTYSIKFSGGFEPIADAGKQPEAPKVKSTKSSEETVRVNSAGARIEEPTPPVKETTSTKTEAAIKTPTTNETKTNETKTNPSSTTAKTTSPPTIKKETPAARRKRLAEERAEEIRKRKEDEANAAAERKKKQEEAAEQRKREAIAKAEADKVRKESEDTNNTSPTSTTPKTTSPRTNASSKTKEPAPDPMASVLLIVETKDGLRIERRMNEVRRVNVEKGILVIVFMDGKIERIPMTEVLKMSIEPQ